MTGAEAPEELPRQTATIEHGVAGPRGESGVLLKAPRSEELMWDLETEIVSARRRWMDDKQGWWIAASYLDTIVSIVLRTHPSVLLLGPEEDRLVSRDGRSEVQGRLTF